MQNEVRLQNAPGIHALVAVHIEGNAYASEKFLGFEEFDVPVCHDREIGLNKIPTGDPVAEYLALQPADRLVIFQGNQERLTTVPNEADRFELIFDCVPRYVPEKLGDQIQGHSLFIAELLVFVTIGAPKVTVFRDFHDKLSDAAF
jgi:hypothetical protein